MANTEELKLTQHINPVLTLGTFVSLLRIGAYAVRAIPGVTSFEGN